MREHDAAADNGDYNFYNHFDAARAEHARRNPVAGEEDAEMGGLDVEEDEEVEEVEEEEFEEE